MLAFAIPPLALVTALSFVRSANANWAAPAVLSMTILAVAFWLRTGDWRWLWATLAVGVAVQVLLIVGDANAYRITRAGAGQQGGHLSAHARLAAARRQGGADRACGTARRPSPPKAVAKWRR